MPFSANKWINVIIFCILITAAFFRATGYGDLRLSIGNDETKSYIEGARAPLFSWKIFAGKRLFTTNIIFKAASNEKKCPMTAYSAPANGAESVRVNLPCFDKIVLLQNFLSIFGWCFLAWMTARWLKDPLIRIAGAVSIVTFGFTPQIAEWDSILSPESLSFSLFVIAFALLMEIAFRASMTEAPFTQKSERILFVGSLIFFLLWIFVRDVHLYAIPMFMMVIAPLLLIKKFKITKQIAIALAVLFAFFVIGLLSTKDSQRATELDPDPANNNAVTNAVDFYIWPYPQRVEFFKKFDMPARESAGYATWANTNATKVYGLFLISHPGFVVTTLWEYLDHFKFDFAQPYYTSDMKYRDSFLKAGEFVHPESMAVFLIDFFLLLALCVHAVKYRSAPLTAWAWLATWFLLIAAVTLFLSFFGDIYGTRRHIFPSVEMFRLFIWIFIMPFLDLSLTKAELAS